MRFLMFLIAADVVWYYLHCNFNRTIGLESLHARGVSTIEVSVAEAPQQSASFSSPLPKDEEALRALEAIPVRSKPRPCLPVDED
jgi:hypothetical protein